MQRYLLAIVLAGVMGCSAGHKPAPRRPSEAAAESGLGNHSHPTSTRNERAQRLFDQGLMLAYAFNHDEALRTFKEAYALDPNFAMAHWGAALVLGPNYNMDVDVAHEKQAHEEVQKALALAASVPQPERDYINALAKRYSNEPKADLAKLARTYAGAMRELMRKYPDDLDAATLFAESMMDLRPWKLWSAEGKPAEGTPEIVATLESVLRRDPDHIGANHLYIHAVEASPHPELALDCAARLPGLAPDCGHLVHMPAHIYQRTGDYEASAGSNEAAIEADKAFVKKRPEPGVYSMMYYSHNLHFLCTAQMMRGRQKDARQAADELAAHVQPHLAHMPMLEGFAMMPMFVMVRFHQYDEILKLPPPAAEQKACAALRHFARGMALAARNDTAAATKERDELVAATKAMPGDAVLGLNSAAKVLEIARDVLDARVALARGDHGAATAALRQAVRAQDALSYDEPPAWPIPAREALGMVQLRSGDFAGAERTFRDDLVRNLRSGRSLFGLLEALRAQHEEYDAKLVEPRFEESWKNADARLTPADLF